jgi:uncharacterized membrane-anchored protein
MKKALIWIVILVLIAFAVGVAWLVKTPGRAR